MQPVGAVVSVALAGAPAVLEVPVAAIRVRAHIGHQAWLVVARHFQP